MEKFMISTNPKDSRLTYRQILLFWMPLAATWLMMSLEGPFLAAVIARLAEPKYNLAAYGITFSLALIVEAPIIMLLSATLALVKDTHSFRKMRAFTWILNIGISIVMLILIYPPVFSFVAGTLIGLPANVSHLAHIATAILLPWPAAIGFRRFYQGLLIRFNMTRRVAYGTAVRLVAMAATAMSLYFLTSLEGAYVGAAALSTGVVLEAIASRIMVHRIMEMLTNADTPLETASLDEPRLSYWNITVFYYPLALSSILGLGVQPIVSFFVGHSRMPIESLAVLPVINSLSFIFACLGLSFQEVGVALMHPHRNRYVPLRNFAVTLGILLTAGAALIAFTPLASFWFGTVSGLSAELTAFAILPFRLMVILPGLMVLLTFQRSALVQAKLTADISWATLIEVIGISLVMFAAINVWDLVGVLAAAAAYLVGRTASNAYLAKPFKRAMKILR
jgi:progressive ankylosis protein